MTDRLTDTGKKRRTFRLRHEQSDALDAAASKKGLDASEYLRRVLDDWFGLDDRPRMPAP